MNIETKCLHSGYTPKNGEPRVLPIYQSTTYTYDTTEQLSELFDLTSNGYSYSRFSNPTVNAIEMKIADLEGGVGALCTTSGQMANLMSILNIMGAGDNFISTATIYGGTVNLFAVTLKKFGIEVRFVDCEDTVEKIESFIDDKTKAIFGETIANPAINVFDIERFANIAHKNNLPLIVDNTFPTPILCRPFEFGADIITHSTTKYMDGHAVQVGGVIVDSGNFDWTCDPKFAEMVLPDESYHGVKYVQDFGKAAYITKARVQLMRDLGAYPSATAAFYLNLGLETLPMRMERHCKNAQAVAEFLEKSDKIESVNYPTLASSKYNELAKKYLPNGASGVVSFTVKGGRDVASKVMNSLKLIAIEIHVAEIRSCVLHPASGTHRQLTDQQLVDCGINPGLIRLSVGCENIEDILEDLKQALS